MKMLLFGTPLPMCNFERAARVSGPPRAKSVDQSCWRGFARHVTRSGDRPNFSPRASLAHWEPPHGTASVDGCGGANPNIVAGNQSLSRCNLALSSIATSRGEVG